MANIFNAAQYLALYPAIADYGYNEANAWDHFVQYGAAELRTPNDELKGKVYAESVLNYANGNPELAEYFGVVVPAESLTAAQQGELLLHYVMYGNAEDRANKIIDAPVQSEDADLTELKEALEAVAAADVDLKAAEKAAADALDEDLETSYQTVSTALNDDIPNFSEVESAEVRTQLIEAKQAQLSSALQQAAADLGKDKGKVDAVLNAEARVKTLALAQGEATVEAEAEAAKAAKLLGLTGEDAFVYEDGAFTYTAGGDAVELAVNAQGKAVLTPETGEAADALKGLSNYDVLVKLLQTNKTLDTQLDAAKKVRDQALKNAENVDAEDAEAYVNAKEAVEAFDALVADFREVEAYKNAVDTAEDTLAAANKAVEDLGYELTELTVDPAANTATGFATPEDDLFVYGNDKETTVYSFGEQGEDLFFFGDFAFVELKANDKFAEGNFGDRNTLEIFAQQQGTDVVLYVEINEVGGNAFGLDNNVNTVTLVGVNLEDLSFDSGAGFLVG